MPSAEEVGRRLEKKPDEFFGPPFHIGASELRLSARAGLVMSPADGVSAESLVKNAEAALMRSKASGERYLFYAEKMRERVAEKLSLENRPRRALEREEFILF